MTRKRPFYVYGEGAVTHGDEPCEWGIGIHHPDIQREEWPSRWAYLKHKLRRRLFASEMRRLAPYMRAGVSPLPLLWQARLASRLLGEPFPRRPTVHAPLRPEDSIYEGAVEEAQRWAERRAVLPDTRSEP